MIAAICSLTRLLQAALAVVAGSISAGMDGRDIKEITGFREELTREGVEGHVR